MGLPSLTGWQGVCARMLHTQTDRQPAIRGRISTACTSYIHAKTTYKSARDLVSGTPSLSVSSGQGPGPGRCRPGGANSNECPSALAAQVMKGGAILVPTYTVAQARYLVSLPSHTHTHTHTKMLRREVTSPRPSSREVGPGFLLNARSTPDCSPSAPQPLHITLCITPRLLNGTLSFAIPAFLRWGPHGDVMFPIPGLQLRHHPCPRHAHLTIRSVISLAPSQAPPRMPRPRPGEQG